MIVWMILISVLFLIVMRPSAVRIFFKFNIIRNAESGLMSHSLIDELPSIEDLPFQTEEQK